MTDGGILWVVATPIGNLEDITLRALRILREADAVLAEDTRHTRHLLSHHDVRTPLRSLHAHTKETKLQSMADEILGGARFALVSDAGTPVVSDPGLRLVAAVRARDGRVEPIPGPSAALAALVACGLRADRFRFLGFLPRAAGKRRRGLEELAGDPAAQVLFESPHRLPALLRDLAPVLGERRVAVCRELTKVHEEIVTGTAAELAERFPRVRGEITIVVEATSLDPEPSAEEADVDTLLRAGLREGRRPGALAKEVAATGAMSRAEAYARLMALREAITASEQE